MINKALRQMFARWLKWAIDRNGISKSDLARISGMSRSQIDNFLDVKHSVTDRSVRKLEKAQGIAFPDLTGWVDSYNFDLEPDTSVADAYRQGWEDRQRALIEEMERPFMRRDDEEAAFAKLDAPIDEHRKKKAKQKGLRRAAGE